MRRTDRYIISAFALAFAATLSLVAVLFVVVDLVQTLDRVVRFFGQEGLLTGVGVVASYYAVRFLSQLAVFGEIVAIVPAVLVASSMARSNEFVGMMAGGLSLRRIALPLFAGCAALGLVTFGLRNTAGPAFVRSEHADYRRIRGRQRTLGKSLSVQGHDKAPKTGATRAVVISLEEFDPSRRAGWGFAAQVIEQAGPLVDIRAPLAVWNEEGHEWRFPEGATKWLYGAGAGAGPLGVGPDRRGPDVPVGRPLEHVEYFRTSLDPDLLEAEELGAGVLTLAGLWRQRARPRFASKLHERIAQAFVPLVMALAALPFVLTTDRSRVLQGTILAILVVAAYEVASRAMLSAAGAGHIPAFIGGWLALAVFAAFGVWRMVKLRT